MREQNRTFEEVAHEAGVSVRTVYNAADGLNCNRGTRKLIAAALDKDIGDLWPPAPASQLPTAEPAQSLAPAEAISANSAVIREIRYE